MRHIFSILTAVILLASNPAFSPAFSQDLLGDPARGREFAIKTCADCHQVNKGARTPKVRPIPAFQDVAKDPAVTAMSLRVFLLLPHKNMPDLVLTKEQTDDVVAYILSLK